MIVEEYLWGLKHAGVSDSINSDTISLLRMAPTTAAWDLEFGEEIMSVF